MSLLPSSRRRSVTAVEDARPSSCSERLGENQALRMVLHQHTDRASELDTEAPSQDVGEIAYEHGMQCCIQIIVGRAESQDNRSS